jgi:MYXO-CTERM domain-containing protein
MRCLLLAASAGVVFASQAAWGSIVYYYNMRSGANQLNQTTTTNFVGDSIPIGPGGLPQTFAMDLTPDGTTLYAVEYVSAHNYGTIDLATGDWTSVGNITGPELGANISGLSVDPTTGDWYLVAIEGAGPMLYAGDITTGVFSQVGAIGGAGFMIDLAIDSQGNAYGHDIGDDMLYSINLGTGLGTPIGSTGLNANYAQGMDFDYADDTLYATVYTGGGTGVFAWFDLNTGFANVIQDTTPLNAEMEMVVATGIPGPAGLSLLLLGGLVAHRRRR